MNLKPVYRVPPQYGDCQKHSRSERRKKGLESPQEEKEATQEEAVARKSSQVKKASSCLLLLSTRSRPNDLRQPTAAVTVTLARKFCHKKRTLERRRSPLAGLSRDSPPSSLLRGFRALPLLRWEGRRGRSCRCIQSARYVRVRVPTYAHLPD